MRVLLVTSHFFPENFKANDMAFELAKRGHEVTVLAPIPDYPQGKFYNGYGFFKKRIEIINGVKIIRTLIVPRHDGSPKWLALNYLTHTLFSSLTALFLALIKKFDTVLVHESSPVMVGIPGVIVKRMQHIPMHFWVLDLWPESLEAAGGLINKKILSVFESLTKWLYKNSDTILISSNGFRKSINKLGDFGPKIKYFPNWVDKSFETSLSFKIPTLPEGFNVVFTGNVGEAQDLPHILQAAYQLKHDGINFIIVGDGRKLEWAIEEVRKLNITNVYFPGRFPIEAMPSFFNEADVLFLSLKKQPIFALTVPAKLQAYMSAGKPIVAMIDGEGADVIRNADCGWSVCAEDSIELSKLLRELSCMDKNAFKLKGENAKKYCKENYDVDKCIDNLEIIISSYNKSY